MAKRILLIYPPSLSMNREDRCQIPVRNVVIEPVYPPMDLLALAAVGESAGFTCRVADYSRGRQSPRSALQDITEFAPDILVMSVTTPTVSADLVFCTQVKKIVPGVTIIAKGAHFLKFSREALEGCPDLDIVIRGETEHTFLDILRGVDRASIPGITWRDSDRVFVNPGRPFTDDLDALPLPARHLIDQNRHLMPHNRRPMGVIRVSRGCPYHCFFCLATPVFGGKVRKRSPGSIVEEVRFCLERYSIKDFVFYSDVFNLDPPWVRELCGSILSSGLKFTWSSNVRLDAVDLETAELMKRAGCFLVSFGVESGSPEVLDKTGKGLTPGQITDAVRILKRAGLGTSPYFMVGLPWDTRQTVEETVRLAIDLDGDYAGIFTATPFPGTKFFDYAVEHRLFDEGTDPHSACFAGAYNHPIVKGHYLSKDDIAALHRAAVRRYYLRPNYVLRTVKKIRSWRELAGYSKTALSLVRFS